MGQTPSVGTVLLTAITLISAIIAWMATSRAAALEHAVRSGAGNPGLQMRLDELESRNRILEDLLDATETPSVSGYLAGPGAPPIRSYYDRPRGLPGDVRDVRPPPPPPTRTRRPAETAPCDCAHCRYEAARAERLRSL